MAGHKTSSPIRLYDDGRKSRRTIADAVESLRDRPGFSEDMRAEISTGRLQLPTGKVVSLVQVICQEIGWAVSLPTSVYFYGTRTTGVAPEEFEISRLEGAVADANSNVELSDGTLLHAVEVQPVCLPDAMTEQEMLIVHAAIAFIGAEARCYRHLRAKKSLKAKFPDELRKAKFLDFATLPGLKIFGLKDFTRYV
ncbi:MAG: hypothetical protein WBW08_06740, partial [Methyloceanibacter sp.]